MNRKKFVIFSIFSALFIIGLGLVLSVPSHPECGTAGIDFMPCAYWSRVIWYNQIGQWIPLAGLWIILNLGYFMYKKSLLTTSTHDTKAKHD
ncbi:hypothetical protein KA021_00785 [Candidatus Saccharibacteria bacterium]|jgi:hypothetical protein|nr:hypothetical protein [Candidatus Saccharibacteria bacterium]